MSRITPGTMLVGIMAVLFGLAGAYTVRQYLHPQEVASAPKVVDNKITVPLASLELEPGRIVSLGDIKLLSLTKEQYAGRKFPSEYMASPQQIIGRVLKNGMKKDSTFTTDDFYPEGMGPSVAERLKPGHRAITVPITNIGMVAGYAVPGSMVDVIFRATGGDKDIPEVTVTLLEGVEVLALGENLVRGSKPHHNQSNTPASQDKSVTVTLAVSPQQANALKVVEGRGELSLVMRNPEDSTTASADSLTMNQLLGVSKKKAFKAEIYHGSARQTLTFERDQVIDEKITGLPIPGAVPPAGKVAKEVSVQSDNADHDDKEPQSDAPAASQAGNQDVSNVN